MRNLVTALFITAIVAITALILLSRADRKLQGLQEPSEPSSVVFSGDFVRVYRFVLDGKTYLVSNKGGIVEHKP